jgi:methylation protein EvaC
MKTKFLDLGKQPIANAFITPDKCVNEFFYDLEVGFDPETKLVSHMNFVDPPLMFNDTYMYHSSGSQTMRNHFIKIANLVNLYFSREKVLEIGSNDGVFLQHFDPKKAFSVEPCENFAKTTRELGYDTYSDFWDMKLSNKIKEDKGEVKVVYSANCMCHIPNIEEAFKAVENILHKDGVFIFEDPSILEMLERNSYDQIYDEHAHLFSVMALDNLLERSGLEIFHIEKTKVHGGSNRIFAQKLKSPKYNNNIVHKVIEDEFEAGVDSITTYYEFAERVAKSKRDLVELLSRLKRGKNKIIGYGATSKSTSVFNYCNIGPETIDYITDTTIAKQGKLSPGVHIPVVSPQEGFDLSVDYAFLGAWNYLEEIKQKEFHFLKRGGKFITHVPKVSLI